MRDEDRTKKQLIDELAGARQRAGELEKALQACTTELKQSQEEFKTFAYVVSHDLRTPLINLRGFSAELRSAVETLLSEIDLVSLHLDERQRQLVNTLLREDIPEAVGFIEFSTARIDNFINAVLKLSRLGRRELRFESVDVDDLVRDALECLADEIEQRQARVTVKSPLPEVFADRTSMEEIVGNVLKNAVIYLDSSRPGEIEVTGERCPDSAVFHIRDNGRGIAEGDVHKVFEPFRRAGRQDVPGDGMGLAYTQTLVRRHGGQVSFMSEPGVGTTFTFSICNQQPKGDVDA